MAALTRQQVKDLITATQRCYDAIQHDAYDPVNHCYRMTDMAMWTAAAKQAVPWVCAEWREIIRVLAQGESYYGGSY